MSESKKDKIHWFEQITGKSLDSLDEDARKHALELGPDGLRSLLSDQVGRSRYRDERVTQGDRIAMQRQIEELERQGGGRWADSEPIIGDKPGDWIKDELAYLQDDE